MDKKYTPNYYKILDVNPTDSQDTINFRANKKLADMHPDRIKHYLAKEKMSDAEKRSEEENARKQYELVREAREVLTSYDKRRKYDDSLKTKKAGSLNTMKDDFDAFMELQKQNDTKEKKDLATLDFNSRNKDLDSKYKLTENTSKLSQKELNSRMQDLQMARQQQEIDFQPKNHFDGKSFERNQFNKMFEAQKKKRKSEDGKNKDLVLWEGVASAYDNGMNTGQFVGINDIGKLYDEDNGDGNYKPLDDDIENVSIGSDDIENVVLEDDNKMDKRAFAKRYEDLVRDREMFDNRNFFNGGDIQENPFNISSQMGKIIGDNFIKASENNNGPMRTLPNSKRK